MSDIPQVEPYVGEAEVAAVSDYLRSGGWLTEFRKTEELERLMAEYLGVDFCTIVTSGTVALYLALLSLEVGPGDVVVVPDFTMIASSNAVRWTGAKVHLVDVSPHTLCLDAENLDVPPRTKAIMHVALNGRAADMMKIRSFCEARGCFLIEDACQAFASRWNGRFLGTFGEVGAFSFSPHKIFTTGQGGAVVTNNPDIHKKVKHLKDFARVAPGVDEHADIGYNFKFTDLQAVVGLEQFRIIDYRIRRKRELFKAYWDALEECAFLELLPTNLEEAVPWFIDPLLVDGVRREDFIRHLEADGVGTRPFYPPIHLQPPYSDAAGPFAVTEDVSSRGVWLPSSIGLSEPELTRVLNSVLSFC